jgi:Apea-like HEPN
MTVRNAAELARTASAVGPYPERVTTYDLVDAPKLRFGVVLNDLADESLEQNVSFGGWILQRAPTDMMVALRDELNRYQTAFDHPSFVGTHDSLVTASGSGHLLERMEDTSRWRIGVLVPTEARTVNGAQLSEALRIATDDLALELWQLQPTSYNSGLGGSPLHCVAALRRCRSTIVPQVIGSGHVAEIVDLRSHLDEARFATILRSIQLFRELDAIHDGNLKLLGYFAVLESILSHKPAANDSADSITRQLKRNLSLLENRLTFANDTFRLNEFGSQKPDKVLAQLYELRSQLTHGGDPRSALEWFEQNRPTRFVSSSPNVWLYSFCRSLVQKTLQCALREPQLVCDLKG